MAMARVTMSTQRSSGLHKYLAPIVAALIAPTIAGAASAQSADNATNKAREHFEAGQQAVKDGDLRSARALFLLSYDLDHAVGPLLNLADCEEKLDLLASARQHFRDAVPLLPPGDPRIAYAEQRASALDAKVPTLSIDLPASLPAGARVLLDNRELTKEARSATQPLDAGTYTVTVTAPGHEDWSRTVKLVDSQRELLVVEVGKPKASSTPPGSPASSSAWCQTRYCGSNEVSPPPSPPVSAPPSDGRATWRAVGWTIGGVGLAGIAVGIGTGVATMQKKSDLEKRCPVPGQCDVPGEKMAADGRTLGTATTVALVAGGVCAAGGVALVLLNRSSTPVEVTAAATPSGAAIGLHGRF
jgi:hypothetical protein